MISKFEVQFSTSLTDLGRVREENQDRVFASAPGSLPCLIVCDGAGGHAGGSRAAETAVEEIKAVLARLEKRERIVPSDLRSALRAANRKIRIIRRDNPEIKDMACTAIVALLSADKWVIAHTGDSRAYLLRDAKLEQLTEDHTEVAIRIREGGMTAEEAKTSNVRSMLLAALGPDEAPDVDAAVIPALPADRILLCSDGLWSMIDDEQIRDIILQASDTTAAARALIAAANASGGDDNIGVAMMFLASKPASIAVTIPVESRPLPKSYPLPTSTTRTVEPQSPSVGYLTAALVIGFIIGVMAMLILSPSGKLPEPMIIIPPATLTVRPLEPSMPESAPIERTESEYVQPELIIDKFDSVVRKQSCVITGKVGPFVELDRLSLDISVNGMPSVAAEFDGQKPTFNHRAKLRDGQNGILFTLTHSSGTKSEKRITITFQRRSQNALTSGITEPSAATANTASSPSSTTTSTGQISSPDPTTINSGSATVNPDESTSAAENKASVVEQQ